MNTGCALNRIRLSRDLSFKLLHADNWMFSTPVATELVYLIKNIAPGDYDNS